MLRKLIYQKALNMLQVFSVMDLLMATLLQRENYVQINLTFRKP